MEPVLWLIKRVYFFDSLGIFLCSLNVLFHTLQGTVTETILYHYLEVILCGEIIWGVDNVYYNNSLGKECMDISKVVLESL